MNILKNLFGKKILLSQKDNPLDQPFVQRIISESFHS
jgi:hypothetical protein